LPKQLITSPRAPKPIGPYSQAIAAGGLLFASGQIALDPETNELIEGDVEAQAERVLRNLMAILEQAGTGPGAVVKTTIYLADMADFPRVNAVYARFLGVEPPARATVQVAGLPMGVSVEIDLIATLEA
jgi:2-iminobutanoate/2-iminopropanoate deaminase